MTTRDVIETVTDKGLRRVESCGCEIESVGGVDGQLYWVPVAACGGHCGCLGCARAREIQATGAAILRRWT